MLTMYEPRSIGEHIECLARLTGAPGSFVEQVRALFVAKGISLDTAAGPFIDALEEAFRREERIRTSTYRARQNLTKLSDNFKRIGRAYVEQVGQVGRTRTRVPAPAGRAATAAASEGRTTQVTIRGDHRTYVTRTEREELPMVPGPADPQ
jgi:hypothetical protein